MGQCISRSSRCSAAVVVVPSPQALLYRLAVKQLIPAVNMDYQLGTSQPDFVLVVVGVLNVVVIGVFLLLAVFGPQPAGPPGPQPAGPPETEIRRIGRVAEVRDQLPGLPGCMEQGPAWSQSTPYRC